MDKSPYRPFKPKHEQMALVPETSGNTINGVGEEGFRRASPIYWHDPDTLVHGDLQKWFYTQDPDNVAIAKAREAREKFLDIEVPPVSSEPLDQSAEAWSVICVRLPPLWTWSCLVLLLCRRNGFLSATT